MDEDYLQDERDRKSMGQKQTNKERKKGRRKESKRSLCGGSIGQSPAGPLSKSENS